jgi:NodT family efflux transporter outer membrane factor (OMF) lipoprotein
MNHTPDRSQGGLTRRCRSSVALAALLACCVGASSCLVGPDYRTPHAEVPTAWSQSGATLECTADEHVCWWQAFNDPALVTLVEQALAQNLTLRQAGLRVIQARALRGIAVGQLYPQSQGAYAGASARDVSESSPEGLGDGEYQEYSIGLEAAWELDFWGRFRRGIEAADALLEASLADYDDLSVLLAADVATSYLLLRSLQAQLAITRANVESQRDTLELTRIRFEVGAVSELDVATAQATLSNTRALVPELEDAARQATFALCVLLGRVPSDLSHELGPGGAAPEAPADIALGIPADLLRRRPDVRRAERIAAALCAEIGVAEADFYPSVTVRGLTGFRTSTFSVPGLSPDASDLFDADSFEGFIGLGVDWPLLNYGRIENNVRAADARFQEALVAYQDVVLRAAAEVEGGLSSFLRSRERAALLAESVTAAERTVELALIQYRQGATDFLRVNQAQVELLERQNSVVIARANTARSAVATYRALGGGWQSRDERALVPQQTIDEMRARTDWGDILAPASTTETRP